MAKVVVKKYMVQVYAKLVISGKYTMDAREVTDDIKFVPEAYHDAVAVWIAEYEASQGE